MFIDYIKHFGNATEVCNDFKSNILAVYFDDGKKQQSSTEDFVWAEEYRNYFIPLKACIQLFGILKFQSFAERERSFYKAASHLENPLYTKTLDDFNLYIDMVKVCFEIAGGEMRAFCSAFDEEEKQRINEAIHNHLEGCCYSCVAMSVSAAESRLLKLMCIVSPDSKKELEENTLGQLLTEYVKNKNEYKSIVPEKHETLLKLCNTYRIFSVHPKKQEIKPPIASSILNLAIEFLADRNTKPDIVKAQLVASDNSPDSS